MDKQNIEDWLRSHRGFIKKNPYIISEKLFGEINSKWVDIIRSAQKSLRKEKFKNTVNFKPQQVEITSNKRNTVNFSPSPYLNGDKNNILIIGDTHIPFERKGYLEHCRRSQQEYNCGTIIHIGDVIDNNYSSYHETDPDGKSAGDELRFAISKLKDWYYTFPTVKVCLGNHDQIIQRKAYSSGLSKRWIKGLNEVLEIPNWDFDIEYEINNVVYTHGTGNAGERAAYNRALNRRKSIVSGHLHTIANISWNVSDMDRIFAMNVGCGIDDKQYCFDYAKNFTKKSIVSCGVVLNNGKLPIIIPMEL